MQVSNNGHPAAMIVPVGGNALDGLIARGEARPARTGLESLLSIKRVVSTMTSGELVDDSRGRW